MPVHSEHPIDFFVSMVTNRHVAYHQRHLCVSLAFPGGGALGPIWCGEAVCHRKGGLRPGQEEEGPDGGVQEERLPAAGGAQSVGHDHGQSQAAEGHTSTVESVGLDYVQRTVIILPTSDSVFSSRFITRFRDWHIRPRSRILLPPFCPLWINVQLPPSPWRPLTRSGRRKNPKLLWINNLPLKLWFPKWAANLLSPAPRLLLLHLR